MCCWQERKNFEPVEKILPALAWLKAKGECIDAVTTRDGNILLKNKNGIIYHIHHRTLVTDTLRAPEMERDGVEIKYPTIWYDEKEMSFTSAAMPVFHNCI